ncbi:MAG: MotA/TolQ/ExbB proton channel family protein [Lachnospiraceae bacterium]|nr:MotA/TolQ/ExbB proton channel family protein [Lachnospiraceae bacterium]
MSFWQVIGKNLLGFDLLIFLLAAGNGVCYYFARLYADQLYKKLNLLVFVPSHKHDPEKVARAIRNIDEAEVVALRKKSEAFYSIFANLTAIFPLMGILGTVVSLLPMVAELTDMQQNFFAALTSTFWGLVFAIIFKLLDGFLSARLEDNDKNVDLLLERRELLKDEGKP